MKNGNSNTNCIWNSRFCLNSNIISNYDESKLGHFYIFSQRNFLREKASHPRSQRQIQNKAKNLRTKLHCILVIISHHTCLQIRAQPSDYPEAHFCCNLTLLIGVCVATFTQHANGHQFETEEKQYA